MNSVASTCPVARATDILGDRWCLLIVRDAFDGVRRFGDFQRSLGIARNILSDRLRKLLEAEILQLQDAADGSSYQEYRLTRKGEDLFVLIVALRQWGEQYLFEPHEARSVLLETASGQALAALQCSNLHGKVIQAADTQVLKPAQ